MSLAESAEQSSVAVYPVRRERMEYVDGLRALAAIIVIFNHGWQQVYWTKEPAARILDAVSPLFSLGHFAVVAFIVLSGYCLMRPVLLSGSLWGGAWGFYKNRALRILPAYYAAILLTLLLIVTIIGQKHDVMYDLSLPVTLSGFASHVLLINNLWPPPFFEQGGNLQICSPFWSIALEWQIYLFFPLLVGLWKRWGIGVTLVLASSMVIALHYLTVDRSIRSFNWLGVNFPFYGFFLFGVLTAFIVFSPQGIRLRAWNWQIAAWCLIIAFCVLQPGAKFTHHGISVFAADLLTALMTMSVLVAASKGGLRGLSWLPLANMGEYAYSIYLLHLPVLAVVTDLLIVPIRHRVSGGIQLVLVIVCGLGLTLTCARAFSRVFEDKKRLAFYWARLMRGRASNLITYR